MRQIGLLFIAFLLTGVLQAQPEDKKVGKITFLMVDGKYEDAVWKATKLIEDSEYRKNPWAYLYMSQGYFEIAKKAELQEKYPKAMKNSLKAAYKLNKYAAKSDDAMEVYNDHQDFLTILKDSAILISQVWADNENYRKAAYYMKSITKFDSDDYAMWLMKGVYEIKSRNVGEGIKSIKLAMEHIDSEYVPEEVSAQTLVDALEEYALIIKSGEFNKYFATYKFEVSESDVPGLMVMHEDFKKYVVGEVVTKEERKKESETIFKTFRSDEVEDDEE